MKKTLKFLLSLMLAFSSLPIVNARANGYVDPSSYNITFVQEDEDTILLTALDEDSAQFLFSLEEVFVYHHDTSLEMSVSDGEMEIEEEFFRVHYTSEAFKHLLAKDGYVISLTSNGYYPYEIHNVSFPFGCKDSSEIDVTVSFDEQYIILTSNADYIKKITYVDFDYGTNSYGFNVDEYTEYSEDFTQIFFDVTKIKGDLKIRIDADGYSQKEIITYIENGVINPTDYDFDVSQKDGNITIDFKDYDDYFSSIEAFSISNDVNYIYLSTEEVIFDEENATVTIPATVLNDLVRGVYTITIYAAEYLYKDISNFVYQTDRQGDYTAEVTELEDEYLFTSNDLEFTENIERISFYGKETMHFYENDLGNNQDGKTLSYDRFEYFTNGKYSVEIMSWINDYYVIAFIEDFQVNKGINDADVEPLEITQIAKDTIELKGNNEYLSCINYIDFAEYGDIGDYSDDWNAVLDDDTLTISHPHIESLGQRYYKLIVGAEGYSRKEVPNVFLSYGKVLSDDIEVSISQDDNTHHLIITSTNADYISSLNHIYFNFIDDGWGSEIVFESFEGEYGYHEKNADLSEDGTTITLFYDNFSYFEEGTKIENISLESEKYTTKDYGSFILKYGAKNADNIEVEIYQDPETYDFVLISDPEYIENIHHVNFGDYEGDYYNFEIVTQDIYNEWGDIEWYKTASISDDGTTLTVFYDEGQYILAGETYDYFIVEAHGYSAKDCGAFTVEYGCEDSSEIDVVISQDEETKDILISSDNTDYIKNIEFLMLYNEEIDLNASSNIDKDNSEISEDGTTLRLYFSNFDYVLAGTSFNEVVVNSRSYTPKHLDAFTFEQGAIDSSEIEVEASQNEDGKYIVIQSEDIEYLGSIFAIYMTNDRYDHYFELNFDLTSMEANAAIVGNELRIHPMMIDCMDTGSYQLTICANGYGLKEIDFELEHYVEQEDYGYDGIYREDESGDGYILTYNEDTLEYKITSLKPLSNPTTLYFFCYSWDSELFEIDTEFDVNLVEAKVGDYYEYTFTSDDFKRYDRPLYEDYYHVGIVEHLGYKWTVKYLTAEPTYFAEVRSLTYEEFDFTKDVLFLTYDKDADLFTLSSKDNLDLYFAYDHEKDLYDTNLVLYAGGYRTESQIFMKSEDGKTFTFTSNDFDHWFEADYDNYYFVVKVEADGYEDQEFALTETPIYFGKQRVMLEDFSDRVLEDSLYNFSYDPTTDTYSFETDGDFEHNNARLIYVRHDEDMIYGIYGELSVRTIYSDGDNRYYFTYDELGTERRYIPEGEYELIFINNDCYYNLTNGTPVHLEAPMKPLPYGAGAFTHHDGILITTQNPTSDESQAWFENIMDNIFEEGDEHHNDDWYNSQINVDGNTFVGEFNKDVFNVMRDEDNHIIGLLLESAKIAYQGVEDDTYVEVVLNTPHYQEMVSRGVYIENGAINSKTVKLTVSQDPDTYDLLIQSENIDYLRAVKHWYMGGHGNSVHEENALLDEENGILRIYYDNIKGIVAEEVEWLDIEASGYTDKKIILDFEIQTGAVKYPEIKIILTQKGLVIRSMNRSYLESIYSIDFQEIVNEHAFDVYTDFEVCRYDDPSKGYYMIIPTSILCEYDIESGVGYRPYIFAEGYEDNLEWLDQAFVLTTFIDIEKDIDDLSATPSQEELEKIDNALESLDNVDIDTIIIEDSQPTDDASIQISGVTTAVIISNGSWMKDYSILEMEDNEQVQVSVTIDNKEVTDENIGLDVNGDLVTDVLKTFDINLYKQVEDGVNQEITELYTYSRFEFDFEAEEGKTYKILTEHEMNGEMTTLLLDAYVEDGKVYFYTDQFSTFSLVEVEETYEVSFYYDWEDHVQCISSGDYITDVPTPTYEGYTFLGWYLEGQKVDPTTIPVTYDMTFFARWVATDYGRTGVQMLTEELAESFVSQMTHLAYMGCDDDFTPEDNAPTLAVYYTMKLEAWHIWQEYLDATEWTYVIPLDIFMDHARTIFKNVDEDVLKADLIAQNDQWMTYFDEETNSVMIPDGGLGDSARYTLDSIERNGSNVTLYIHWHDYADDSIYHYAKIYLEASSEYGLRFVGFEKFDEVIENENPYQVAIDFVAFDDGNAYASITVDTNECEVTFGDEFTLYDYEGIWYKEGTTTIPFTLELPEKYCSLHVSSSIGEVVDQQIILDEGCIEPIMLSVFVKVDHTDSPLEGKEPTCKQDGLTEGVICSECEEILVEQTIIPALGHDYDENGVCQVCQTEKPNVDVNVESDKVEIKEETATKLESSVTTMVEDIIESEEVKGVSQETIDTITSAIENNDTYNIVTTIVVEEITEEEIDEDVIISIEETTGEGTLVQYLDLSINLDVYVNDELVQEDKLTELKEPVSFTIEVPEELKEVPFGTIRTYYIIRVHDGVTEKIPTTLNADGTISFETDRFSIYALAYEDTEDTTAVLYGDINNDGKVNSFDRNILARYVANWDGYDINNYNAAAADVNLDGKVNSFDRNILARHIAAWDGYETLPYK